MKNQDDPAPNALPGALDYHLSTYGDDGNRQFPKFWSITVAMASYALFMLAAMLPILLLVVVGCMAAGMRIPASVLTTAVALISLDLLVPLPNGLQPDKQRKHDMERLSAEAGRHYFPARSILLAKTLSKDKAYILAAWPHALMGGGSHFGLCQFIDDGFYPIYSGASVMRYVPFMRRFIHWLGFVDVSKASLSKVLNVNKYGSSYPYNVVHLVVGGIHEMFYTPLGSEYEQIIVRRRKGFIKLALETGCDIIPMYTFGINQAYLRLAGPHSWLCTLSKVLRLSLVVWLGRWWLPMGFLPRPVPVLSVIGQVFEVPKVRRTDDITDELVQEVHEDFCQVLRQLYNDYRHVYVKEMGADEKWLTRELRFEDE